MEVLLFFLFILTSVALLKWFLENIANWNGLKYGDIFGFFIGTIPILLVTEPELLKIIEVKKAQIFHKRNPFIPVAGVPNEIIKFSTVLNYGPVWKQATDMISPSYTTSKLKMLTNIINRVIDENWKEMREIIKNGNNPDMKKIFSTFLADMSFQTALGFRIHDKENVVKSLNVAFNTDFKNPINFISVCLPEVKNLLYFIRTSSDTVKHLLSQPSMLTIVEMCKDAISARLSMEKNNYVDLLQQMINTIFKRKDINFQKHTENSGSHVSYDHTSLLIYTDCLAVSTLLLPLMIPFGIP